MGTKDHVITGVGDVLFTVAPVFTFFITVIRSYPSIWARKPFLGLLVHVGPQMILGSAFCVFLSYVFFLRYEWLAIIWALFAVLLPPVGPSLFWFLVARPYRRQGGTIIDKCKNYSADLLTLKAAHFSVPVLVAVQVLFCFTLLILIIGLCLQIAGLPEVLKARLALQKFLYLYDLAWARLVLAIFVAWFLCLPIAWKNERSWRRSLSYLLVALSLCVPLLGERLHWRNLAKTEMAP